MPWARHRASTRARPRRMRACARTTSVRAGAGGRVAIARRGQRRHVLPRWASERVRVLWARGGRWSDETPSLRRAGAFLFGLRHFGLRRGAFEQWLEELAGVGAGGFGDVFGCSCSYDFAAGVAALWT